MCDTNKETLGEISRRKRGKVRLRILPTTRKKKYPQQSYYLRHSVHPLRIWATPFKNSDGCDRGRGDEIESKREERESHGIEGIVLYLSRILLLLDIFFYLYSSVSLDPILFQCSSRPHVVGDRTLLSCLFLCEYI